MWLKSKDMLVNLERLAYIEVRRSLTGDEEFSIDGYLAEEKPRVTLFEVSGPDARAEAESVYDLICEAVASDRRSLDISDRVVTPGA